MGRVPLYLCVFLFSFYPFECEHDNTEDADWHVEPLFTESDAGFHMPELFAGEDANENGSRIPLPSPYLTLPVFTDSIVPLVNKELLNPTRMTGLEPMPGKLRKVLLPSSPNSHPTTRPSSGRRDVVVSCGNSKMRVVVRKRTLGSTALASQLTLGTCGVRDETAHFFIFNNNVSSCGSEKSIINNQLVYSNTLYYTPEAPKGLIRTAMPFALSISCHYNRFYYSYKIGYLPDIKTHQIFRSMSQSSNFTLTPCDDQWERLPETQGYVIGSVMYFEARSPPLSGDQRLFISFCYATPSQNVSDTLRFSVIENYGCMADSKVPHSQSRFIRHKRNVLRFMVEAFLFEGMTAEHVHMHCEMFVANHTATEIAKSCTYNSATDRWEELYNNTQVCTCCDSTCISTEAELPATKKIVTSGSWTLEPDNGTVVGEATVEWDEGIPTVAMAVIKPMVKEVNETVTKMVTEPEIGRWTRPEMRRRTRPGSRRVTEPVTPEVSEPEIRRWTQPGSKKVTEVVTPVVSEPEIRRWTQPGSKKVTEVVTPEVTEPEIRRWTQPGSKKVTEMVTPEVTEPEIRRWTQPGSKKVTEMVTPEVSEPEIRRWTRPGGSKVIEPVTPEVSEPEIRRWTSPGIKRRTRPRNRKVTERVTPTKTDKVTKQKPVRGSGVKKAEKASVPLLSFKEVFGIP